MAPNTMFYSDEVRSTGDLSIPGENVEETESDLTMAKSLVDMLTGEFDFAQYKDNYREALLEVIAKKAEGEVIEAPAPAPAKITDLTAAPASGLTRAPSRLCNIRGNHA